MNTQQNYKIIISGPVGAGKTTAIAALSDIVPVRTDARPTDEVAAAKNATTVALDYGTIELGAEAKVHLYGTPGQDRFDFMWDIMTDGALGLILLMNNAQPDPLADLRQFLSAFSDFLQTAPFCVGVTHMDVKSTPTLEDYHKAMSRQVRDRVVPVFSVDGRSRRDVNVLLMAMLGMIEPRILADVANSQAA
ncbi:MAG TPA: GTP-binding protein [Chromatiales bacterium]|nr:GTP-binding protein [Chromatiales bacterium]